MTLAQQGAKSGIAQGDLVAVAGQLEKVVAAAENLNRIIEEIQAQTNSSDTEPNPSLLIRTQHDVAAFLKLVAPQIGADADASNSHWSVALSPLRLAALEIQVRDGISTAQLDTVREVATRICGQVIASLQSMLESFDSFLGKDEKRQVEKLRREHPAIPQLRRLCGNGITAQMFTNNRDFVPAILAGTCGIKEMVAEALLDSNVAMGQMFKNLSPLAASDRTLDITRSKQDQRTLLHLGLAITNISVEAPYNVARFLNKEFGGGASSNDPVEISAALVSLANKDFIPPEIVHAAKILQSRIFAAEQVANRLHVGADNLRTRLADIPRGLSGFNLKNAVKDQRKLLDTRRLREHDVAVSYRELIKATVAASSSPIGYKVEKLVDPAQWLTEGVKLELLGEIHKLPRAVIAGKLSDALSLYEQLQSLRSIGETLSKIAFAKEGLASAELRQIAELHRERVGRLQHHALRLAGVNSSLQGAIESARGRIGDAKRAEKSLRDVQELVNTYAKEPTKEAVAALIRGIACLHFYEFTIETAEVYRTFLRSMQVQILDKLGLSSDLSHEHALLWRAISLVAEKFSNNEAMEELVRALDEVADSTEGIEVPVTDELVTKRIRMYLSEVTISPNLGYLRRWEFNVNYLSGILPKSFFRGQGFTSIEGLQATHEITLTLRPAAFEVLREMLPRFQAFLERRVAEAIRERDSDAKSDSSFACNWRVELLDEKEATE
jgi:hypothetical protein